jgi:inner membrane protein
MRSRIPPKEGLEDTRIIVFPAPFLFVDSFTHTLAIGIILYAAAMPEFIVWGVMGAIILDLDVLLFPFSDPHPSLFIFSHGGITHTLIGAAVISAGAFFILRRILSGRFVQDRLLPRFPQVKDYVPGNSPSTALFAVMAGAFLHLGLDCCASPGLPLLYPVSLHKYTLGMLSGSSMILFAMSLILVGLLLSGRITPRHLKVYGILFLAILLFSAGMKLHISTVSTGKSVPTLNPFSWLIIEENDTAYRVEEYEVFEGISRETTIGKYQNISPWEAGQVMLLPETRRLCYFSYLMVVEKNSTTVKIYDPLRKNQTIWYPPYYTTVELPNGSYRDVMDPSDPE